MQDMHEANVALYAACAAESAAFAKGLPDVSTLWVESAAQKKRI